MAERPFEEFQKKFRTGELEIRSFSHWLWTARGVQSTLGAGVLSLKRYAAGFPGLTPEEAAELPEAARVLEGALQKAFSPDKMNYLMLMMVDPHVHFHVLPRYAEPRTFAGREWSDVGWPALPVVSGDPAPDAVLFEVRDRLRSLV